MQASYNILAKFFKTVNYLDREYIELDDLTKDPLKINNLWDNEDYRMIINKLYKFIERCNVPWNIGTPEI